MPRKIPIRSPAPATSIIPVAEIRMSPTNSPRRSTEAGSRHASRIVSAAADRKTMLKSRLKRSARRPPSNASWRSPQSTTDMTIAATMPASPTSAGP